MAQVLPDGAYRQSASFQTATLILDATCLFCDKFQAQVPRMAENLVLAARSARMYIVAGSRAAAASSRAELRPLNAARSGFEKLLLDFEDFLRQRRLVQWAPGSEEAAGVGQAAQKHAQGDQPDQAGSSGLTDQERWALFAQWVEHDDPAVCANALICLIRQANSLLDRQIESIETVPVRKGGGSERSAAAYPASDFRSGSLDEPDDRSDYSENQDEPVEPDPAVRQAQPARPGKPDQPGDRPNCPTCGKPMVLRTARTGKNSGSNFWGCSGYPKCKGTMNA